VSDTQPIWKKEISLRRKPKAEAPASAPKAKRAHPKF